MSGMCETKTYDVIVVGGGAAGLAAAISAANVFPCLNVAIFEADERVGRSILATGNGRCNFSNAYISPEVYRNAPFVSEVFAALERVAPWGQGGATGSATSGENGSANASATGGENGSQKNAVLAFFSWLGLMWREEAQTTACARANAPSARRNV